jgi:SAM-dependent methyltransferase
VELDEDPAGLANVCHPGQPLWLNRYHARLQRKVYRELLSLVPAPARGARALDVGCGAARWSKLLADQGYDTVAIDLQDRLIEANRRRYPDIEFHTASAQEFTSAEPFDLISTVTVIQHVPFEHQLAVIQRLRALSAAGGHVIALENVFDQGPHVFARSIAGWRELFELASLEPLATRRYDYSPCQRLLARLKRVLRSKRRSDLPPTPETLNTPPEPDAATWRGLGRSAHRALMRACVAVDGATEPACFRLQPALSTVHCGFLFRAV